MILHRSVAPVGRGQASLRSLTVGRAGVFGRPSEVRFTSMVGGFEIDFPPSVAKSLVFGEVAALGFRETRPALLP
jgi:hypothetical protein